MMVPAAFRTVIVSVAVCELGLTIATAVAALVSSQIRVLVVADAPEKLDHRLLVGSAANTLTEYAVRHHTRWHR